MTNTIKSRFLELKTIGQRAAIQLKEDKDRLLSDYLKSLIQKGDVTDFFDLGFCYWNISDSFALLKDGKALYENHKLFAEHIKNSEYLYWAVCDATQRFTLEKDGFTDFWWSLYCEAVKEDKSNNTFTAFSAHRTALSVNPVLPHKDSNLIFAKTAFEELLLNTKETAEHSFYKLIYLSLVARFDKEYLSQIKPLCESIFKNLSEPQIKPDYLIGEWGYVNTPFCKRRMSVVGITAGINALIYCCEKISAKELYNSAVCSGLPRNKYIENRIDL